ncbi:hypothetical protein ACHZ97_08415 [Lysobacter soli]|uniref:hypothetical protein n=1 Tax=Lysobacter soli TaxID=453783 RepID=UPI0037C5A099
MSCARDPIPYPSHFPLPSRPWKGLRRRNSRFAPFKTLFPLLQPLEFEIAVFRELMLNPTRHLYYHRGFTLQRQRSIGAERVSQVALRDGYPYEAIVNLILHIAVEANIPDSFPTTRELVRMIVDEELSRIRRQGDHLDRN